MVHESLPSGENQRPPLPLPPGFKPAVPPTHEEQYLGQMAELNQWIPVEPVTLDDLNRMTAEVDEPPKGMGWSQWLALNPGERQRLVLQAKYPEGYNLRALPPAEDGQPRFMIEEPVSSEKHK